MPILLLSPRQTEDAQRLWQACITEKWQVTRAHGWRVPDKEVNQHKANRLPHEAGLKLLSVPRAPKELPATAFIRNSHEIADWKLFVEE